LYGSNMFSHQIQNSEKFDETGYITCIKFRTILILDTKSVQI